MGLEGRVGTAVISATTALKAQRVALARWLSWLEHRPTHQKAVGSIPGQGTQLGFRFHPWSGRIPEATSQCFSLTSMFLSLPSSLKSIKTNPQVRMKIKIE